MPPALSDLQSTDRLLSFTRIPLVQPAVHTRQLAVGAQITVDDLVRLVDVTAGPNAALVVHGRRDPTDTEPRFSVRVVSAPHDASSTMLQALIDQPRTYRDLLTAWNGPGPVVNCLTVSCFLDTEWQSRWMAVLLEQPSVLLLDTVLSPLTGAGRPLGHNEPVWGRHLDIGHPQLRGLVWHVEGQHFVRQPEGTVNPAADYAAPTGVYYGRGWTVDVGADAAAEAARVDSMHEAMHERLQFTTIYGVLAEVHSAVARYHRRSGLGSQGSGDDARLPDRARGVRDLDVGDDLRLEHGAPRRRVAQYRRHGRSSARRVASLTSPYLAMHGFKR